MKKVEKLSENFKKTIDIYTQRVYNVINPRGKTTSHTSANTKFEVMFMTVEIKLSIKVEKKKGSAKSQKGKSQSQSQSTNIIIHK